jgi:hypothetical protein
MAIYVDIKKFAYENGSYYYVVTTNDFGGCTCYILIDASNKLLTFFNTDLFTNPLEIVSLEEPGYFKDVPGINKSVSNLVIVQAYKAINAQSFPQNIGFYC